MKLGIMQPYLFPYIGYFQLIRAVDKFIIYDDVNYIKGGWINRNRLLIDGRDKLFTLHLINKSSFNKINQTVLTKDNENKKRIVSLVKYGYQKSPYYNELSNMINEIIMYDESNLALYVANSIIKVCRYLDIDTEIVFSSSIAKNESLKGEEKIIQLCEIVDANTYINAIGGQKLYSKENFISHNIELNFIKMLPFEYRQYSNQFIPNLSIIDALMFNNARSVKEMLCKYILI